MIAPSLKHIFLIGVIIVCLNANADEPDVLSKTVAQSRSPLLTSIESTILLGTFCDATERGTGIAVNPSAVGTDTFVVFKAIPDSEFFELLGLREMEMVSDDIYSDAKRRRVTQERIYATKPDKDSVRTILKYVVTDHSALSVDGVAHQSAQVHYRASIYMIKGTVDVQYHKTFSVSTAQ